MSIKYDLSDVTFVIPIRIDSEERHSNLKALLKVLIREFNTHIIILEGDKDQLINIEQIGFDYHFVYDDDPIFHRTKYINQLINISITPIVAVWDVDAIGIPLQILDAVERIRTENAVMAFPFDGRFYSVNPSMSHLFRQTLQYEVFTENIPQMHLMHGYYSVGGAYIIHKKKYLQAGGENENFYGWGPEDAERVRRMEIFGLPVYHSSGFLFHLWHSRSCWFANKETEMQNRKEFVRICGNTKLQLKENL
jgi:predicted glycosyltransferase involved in capsule biosynthesis